MAVAIKAYYKQFWRILRHFCSSYLVNFDKRIDNRMKKIQWNVILHHSNTNTVSKNEDRVKVKNEHLRPFLASPPSAPSFPPHCIVTRSYALCNSSFSIAPSFKVGIQITLFRALISTTFPLLQKNIKIHLEGYQHSW